MGAHVLWKAVACRARGGKALLKTSVTPNHLKGRYKAPRTLQTVIGKRGRVSSDTQYFLDSPGKWATGLDRGRRSARGMEGSRRLGKGSEEYRGIVVKDETLRGAIDVRDGL